MLNMYQSTNGEHVAPESLTPEEAVSHFEARRLEFVDFGRLSTAARSAVRSLLPQPRGCGVVIVAIRGAA